jgi:hypothetical protein
MITPKSYSFLLLKSSSSSGGGGGGGGGGEVHIPIKDKGT